MSQTTLAIAAKDRTLKRTQIFLAKVELQTRPANLRTADICSEEHS